MENLNSAIKMDEEIQPPPSYSSLFVPQEIKHDPIPGTYTSFIEIPIANIEPFIESENVKIEPLTIIASSESACTWRKTMKWCGFVLLIVFTTLVTMILASIR